MKLGSFKRTCLTKEQEERFPALVSRRTFMARYGLVLFLAYDFLWVGAQLADAFWPRPAGFHWSSPRFLWAVGIPIAWGGWCFIELAKGWSAKRELAAKGYDRLVSSFTLLAMSMEFGRGLLARIPPFSEIEHTPYNNPNDPDALLRMLDDLAAQMDGDAGD